jgi:hypothetical protein
MQPLEAFHVELTCVGTSISVSVNGVQAASARDDTYGSGNHALAAGLGGATSDARVSHLTVTQR